VSKRHRNALSFALVGALASLGVYACQSDDATTPRLVAPDASTLDASSLDSGADDPGENVIGPDPCGCDEYQRCTSGSCGYVPAALVELGITTIHDGDAGADQAFAESQVCFYRHVEADASANLPVTTDGDCQVYEQDGGAPPADSLDLMEADIGTVTVKGASAGTSTFQSGNGSCLKSSRGEGLPFSGGENLTIEATGGDDFPAFTVTVTAPEPLVLTADAVAKGEPLPITWTGTSDGTIALTVTTARDAESTYVTCKVKDTGSFTVPASVTDHLFDDPTATFVHGERVVTRMARPSKKMVNMGVRLTTSDSL
jgi:hypothetical protein